MQIFNISDLFATPVIAATTAETLNKPSRKRRRKAAQVALPNVNCVQQAVTNADTKVEEKEIGQCCDKATNTVAVKKKRSKKKRNVKAAEELSSLATATIDHSYASKLGDNTGSNPERQVTDEMKAEMKELTSSLESITSHRNALEKSLSELREENDRLVRSNEDLKDELKEMTDEALELSVEKQRLLSKIGTLKKQLLNRPK